MPDFHTSVASLKVVQRSLDAAIAAEPATANATMRLRAALAVAPDMAVFGALLDAILYHCGPTQPELGLLTDAAILWQQYRPLMERLSKARALLDSLVTDPTQPGMAAETRNLSASLHHLGVDIHDWGISSVAFLRQLQRLTYLPVVGQSQDAPVGLWSWLDLATGRRTGALRAALLDRAVASGDTGAIAFAYGAIAGYAGGLCASGYRNGVVGGPRRSHPYRSRLAARTLGAWLRHNRAGDTLTSTDLRQRVAVLLGNPASFPAGARTALAEAWVQAYGNVVPAPDLDRAAVRVARHLDLLSLFTMSDPGALPPVPVPPPVAVAVQTAIQQRGLNTFNGTPWPVPPGPRPPITIATGSSFWKTLLASVITLILGLVGALIGGLIEGVGAPAGAGVGVAAGVAIGKLLHLWELESTPADTRMSSLRSDDALLACAYLDLLHQYLYAAGDQFLLALKGAGLIYPESRDLSAVVFGQFLQMPREDPVFRRPDPDPDRFTVYPQTAVEEPILVDFPYPPLSPPGVFLDPPAGGPDPAVASLGLRLWLEEEGGGGGKDLRQKNRQLDADRGSRDVCWQGRVSVNPIQVNQLAYADL